VNALRDAFFINRESHPDLCVAGERKRVDGIGKIQVGGTDKFGSGYTGADTKSSWGDRIVSRLAGIGRSGKQD
jgi:hypothetical protein